eukprot:s1143_g16.t1
MEDLKRKSNSNERKKFKSRTEERKSRNERKEATNGMDELQRNEEVQSLPLAHLMLRSRIFCCTCTGLALVAALVGCWVRVAPRLFCVAGVALGDICLRFVWQVWHLATSAFVLCNRRGTNGTGLALVAALVAALVGAGSVWRRASFAWQAWHLATSALGGGLGRRCVRVAPRVFYVAGVARGDICLRFVWQAWHLATSAFVLCGRRGAHGSCIRFV